MECGTTRWLAALLLVPLVAAELTYWTIHSPECVLSSDPDKHPVSSRGINWLKLKYLHEISSSFFIMFRGQSHYKSPCDLQQRHLYQVTKHDEYNAFNFDPLDPPAKPLLCSPDFELMEESYGFVSCAKNKSVASAQAEEWLQTLPFEYTMEVSIAAGVLGAVLVVVAVVLALRKWRNRNHHAALPVLGDNNTRSQQTRQFNPLL